MAANRPTNVAPAWLCRLSKATLADLVWELAAQSPYVESCDDRWQIARALQMTAKGPAEVPARDQKLIAAMLAAYAEEDLKGAPATEPAPPPARMSLVSVEVEGDAQGVGAVLGAAVKLANLERGGS